MNKAAFDNDRFVDDLNKFMITTGINRSELSAMAGLHASNIGRILKGVSAPSARTVHLLAKVMNVSPGDYYVGKNHLLNIEVLATNASNMSIEELDEIITKLQAIRKEKLSEEWRKVNEVQERLKRLGALQSEG